MAKSVRKTKETEIQVEINFDNKRNIDINTGVPFFDHILQGMSLHGGFSLTIRAKGDINIDPHHLVEDTGLVLGDCLAEIIRSEKTLKRFGHAVIPMDDALSEAVVDACGRPNLTYTASYPQERVGDFDISLLKEFLKALCSRSGITLHAACRYGDNSHHMAESLFKALGKAVGQAFTKDVFLPSTKGTLT